MYKRQVKIKEPTSKWYTDDLAEMAKKVRKAYLLQRDKPSTLHRQEYLKVQKKYKKACIKARRDSWRSFASQADNVQKMATLNKILQKKQNNKIDILQKTNGALSDPGQDTVQTLLEAHFPAATAVPHVQYTAEGAVDLAHVRDKFKQWVSETLIVRALRKFDLKKSPGPDGLKPIIFKYLPANVISFLADIYICAFALQYTPKLWKETKVIFIPKPGKSDYSTPKSF